MPRIVWIYALTIVGIAFAAIFVRLALPAPPTITGFYRMFFAALAMAAWRGADAAAHQVDGSHRRLRRSPSGVCFGLDLAFWHTSIVETSVGARDAAREPDAGARRSLRGAGAARAAGAALRRPARRSRCVGMLLLLGVPGAGHGRRCAGAGFAIVASLFYAGYLLWMSEARREIARLLGAVPDDGVVDGACSAVAALALGDPFARLPVAARGPRCSAAR